MLKRLIIKNYALIEEASLDFSPELNILTGETGAGKSLLIEALSALLGVKISLDNIRSGEEKCLIEAVFSLDPLSPLRKILQDDGAEVDDELIIRREYYASGRNRCFINDSPVTLKRLVELGGYLVDLCGQNEHQRLFAPDNHLEYLDRFAKLMPLRQEVVSLYDNYRKTAHRLNELGKKHRYQSERQDRLEFEIKEIEAAAPQIDEESRLLAEEKELENGEQLLEFCYEAEQELNSKKDAVLPVLDRLLLKADKFRSFSPHFKRIYEDLFNADASLKEALRALVAFRSHFDFNPQRLEEIRLRLGDLSSLKRKYGGSIDAVLSKLQHLKQERNSLTSLQEDIVKTSQELSAVKSALTEKALLLSQNRSSAAPELIERLNQELLHLGFNYADFQILLQKRSGQDLNYQGQSYSIQASGIDTCEFYVSTNIGEPPLPLKEVASGGEISRIMLTLKSLLADKDRAGALIFDEIDNGISGRIARKVGLKLYRTARSLQTLVVTHLPQIASLPGKHFSVAKIEEDGRSISKFHILNDKDRISEIASLIAAGEIKGKAEDYARQLLNATDIIEP